MRELSLFTGAGGGLLGTHLLGWEPVGYVEWNEYCQQVLAARIRDGYLRKAPIFTDVREFVQSGAAREYRGFADVVTAGFPCQPFSVAGKQRASNDDRNMWPATRDVIRIVRPRSVLLENVPGLVSCGYIGRVLCDLAEMGFVGKWGILGASDTGAKHKRLRWWVRANAISHGLQERMHVSNSSRESDEWEQSRNEADRVPSSKNASNPHGWKRSLGGASGRVWRIEQSISRNRDWSFTTQPVLDRGADGMAHRVDRLKALGNGQVPAVVEEAWGLMA